MKNKIADIKSGIQIIDIKDRNNPEIVGSFDTSGRANNIFVEGDIAYVADGDDGLQILDIKDKRNPFSIDNIPLKKVNDVYILGSYAYIAFEKGVKVMEILK